jgi:hypothetical protein
MFFASSLKEYEGRVVVNIPRLPSPIQRRSCQMAENSSGHPASRHGTGFPPLPERRRAAGVSAHIPPEIDFSPQALLIMWKTGGVAYGRTVDNLSGPVENPPQAQVSGPRSERRIPGSFHRNMLIVRLNGPRTYKNMAYCPRSSVRALFRDVIFRSRF